MIASSWAVFQKDLRLELRTRVAFNTALLFGIVALVVVSFSVGAEELSPTVLASLLWTVLLFTAISSLAMLFVREEDSGTALLLRVTAPATSVFLGKYVLNAVFFFIQLLVIVPLYHLFLKPPLISLGWYTLFLFLGLACFAVAGTFTSALVARASARGGLFAVLALPILIIPLWSLVRGTALLFVPGESADLFAALTPFLRVLIAYIVVMSALAFLLFPALWDE